MSHDAISASPTKIAPVSDMIMVVPKVNCDVKSCEVTLNIGLFFDGTNNNMYRDFPRLADTNIARLFRSYADKRIDGYERVYIPGVGTSFPEIGESGESKLGTGWAFGCEGRVVFGLLSVINFLSYRSLKDYLFDEKAVLGLCRNRSLFSGVDDRENLAKFDMDMSLVTGAAEGVNIRHLFLRKQLDLLEAKLKNKKPRIAECFIDVFGFSRGAAEARVFCNWLNELLVNGCLAGVPLQLRFLGIIDTVASAGFWSGTTALIKNSTGGHGSWASAKSLRVPSLVQNCLHMVAMHELRRNFPLDAFGRKDRMSSGWVQYAYPGAHSDVGGGYRPGELGLAVADDSKKLSQIPLNHMFDCAVAAGVPLKKNRDSTIARDPFAIHSDVIKSYDDFISQATLAPRPMYEWLQPYLNWRWQIRERFHTSNQVVRAVQEEKEILLTFNKRLINDANAMTRTKDMSFGRRIFEIAKDRTFTRGKKDLVTTLFLEPEAQSVLELAKKSRTTPPSFATLFDNYVHDSLAGFNLHHLELSGYWRYRKVFLDSDDHLIALNGNAVATERVA